MLAAAVAAAARRRPRRALSSPRRRIPAARRHWPWCSQYWGRAGRPRRDRGGAAGAGAARRSPGRGWPRSRRARGLTAVAHEGDLGHLRDSRRQGASADRRLGDGRRPLPRRRGHRVRRRRRERDRARSRARRRRGASTSTTFERALGGRRPLDAAGRAAADVIAASSLALLPRRPGGRTPRYDGAGRARRSRRRARAATRTPRRDARPRRSRSTPRGPEALVERGGLRFLQRRYDDAIADLEAALRIRDDAYARDLLAQHAPAHRPQRARARGVEPPRQAARCGKVHASPACAHMPRAVGPPRADRRRRAAARRCAATGARGCGSRRSGLFDGCELRPVVTAPRARSTSRSTLLERHGFGGHPGAGRPRRSSTARARRSASATRTCSGRASPWAASTSGRTRSRTSAQRRPCSRPLGFPGMLSRRRVPGAADLRPRGRQRALPPARRGGGECDARVVVASRTVVAGRPARPGPAPRTSRAGRAATGRFVGLELGLDHTLLVRPASRARGLGPARDRAAGGDVRFAAGSRGSSTTSTSQRPDGLPLEHGSIAVQVHRRARRATARRSTRCSRRAPRRRWSFPLRAHRQKDERRPRRGAHRAGRSPSPTSNGGSASSRRTASRSGTSFSMTAAVMGRTAQGGDETLHDVGVGLRLGVRGKLLLRGDYGHGAHGREKCPDRWHRTGRFEFNDLR